MFSRYLSRLRAIQARQTYLLPGLLLLAVLLLLYLSGSWETNRQRTLAQLEALATVAQSNTRLLQQQLTSQLVSLQQNLPAQSLQDWSLWVRQQHKPRPLYSHIALYSADGQLLAMLSTVRVTNERERERETETETER